MSIDISDTLLLLYFVKKMSEHRYDIRILETCDDPNLLMVERQDPDNFTLFQARERCELEIATYVFKDLPIGEMVGPGALAVCCAHRGLPVGFLFLWYSVLFTVESLSLLHLLVIS